MNDNQRFDDHIKEQLQNYTPAVNPGIWNNIVKEREKRKPAGFWPSFFNGRTILLLTVLFIASGTAAFLLLKNTKPAAPINNIVTNSATPATTVEANKNNNAQLPVAANQTTNTINNNNITTSTTVTAEEETNTKNNSTTTNVADENLNNKTNKSSYNNSGKTKFKIHTPVVQDADNNTTANKKNKKSIATGINNDYEITAADISSAPNTSKPDHFLNRLSFTAIQNTVVTKKTVALNKRYVPNVYLPDCPSIEKNAAGNKTYVEVYGGPDIAFSNLSDTGNSAYLQKRKESTKFSSAYSAGIRYTKVFNNGMSVRTGINYSQINEKFTFVQGNLVQLTYIINASGDTTGSYITRGTRYKTTINKFRTVDVPLLIGYEMGNGRFHANINAGMIVNIYSWQKGDVLDTTFRPISITTGKSNSAYQFKTNIGMGFLVGASLYYKINDRIHVLAEPYFRYSLAPMSNEKLTLKQKYNTAGLRIGVRVDLQ